MIFSSHICVSYLSPNLTRYYRVPSLTKTICAFSGPLDTWTNSAAPVAHDHVLLVRGHTPTTIRKRQLPDGQEFPCRAHIRPLREMLNHTCLLGYVCRSGWQSCGIIYRHFCSITYRLARMYGKVMPNGERSIGRLNFALKRLAYVRRHACTSRSCLTQEPEMYRLLVSTDIESARQRGLKSSSHVPFGKKRIVSVFFLSSK
jgi:hypothetical protein